jgi:hypothetical protein
MIRSLLCALLLISLGSGLHAEGLVDTLKAAEVGRIDTMFVIPAGPVAGSFTSDCRMQVVDTVAGWAKIQVEGWVPVGRVMNRFESANNYYISSSIAPSAEKAARQRCIAITTKGSQCKRAAKLGSQYCWQHQAK